MGTVANLRAVGFGALACAVLGGCGLTEKDELGERADVGDVGDVVGVVGVGGVGAGGSSTNSGGSAGLSEPGSGGTGAVSRCDLSELACVNSEASPPGHRLLWADLYNNALADLFGATPVADAQTFPLGLDEAGFAHVSELGREVAAELSADPESLLACASDESEAECVDRFIVEDGLRIYRSPLSESERAALREVFDEARGSSLSEGLEALLVALLTSERFLYLSQVGQALLGVPGGLPSAPPAALPRGAAALGGFELAARLGAWLWLSTPDDTLLELAESGELTRPEVLREQVRRMLNDPRASRGLDAFHSEWLGLDALPWAVERGDVSAELAGAMGEESLQLGRDAYLEDNSFEALFGSTRAYVNPALGDIYGAVPDAGAEPETLVPVELPAAERPGLFTRAGWLTATSPGGQNHPSQRGARLLQNQLCVVAPVPPPDHADLAIPEDVPLSEYLREVGTWSQCAGCHAWFDPIGLAFEKYDAFGYYRSNAAEIETAGSQQIGDVATVSFEDAADLSRQLGEHPNAYACLGEQWLRRVTFTDTVSCSTRQAARKTCETGELVELLAELATTEAFRLVNYGSNTPSPVRCEREGSMNCEFLASRTGIDLAECLEQQGAACDPAIPDGVLPCLGVRVIRGCCSDDECRLAGISPFCGQGTSPHGICVTDDAF